MANNDTDQMPPPRVLVSRMSQKAVFPSGFILSTTKTINLPHWVGTPVPTDLRFTVPLGVRFRIVLLPELSQKSIKVADEFIGPCTDAPVLFTLYNTSGAQIQLKAGEQIARLEPLHGFVPEFVDVTPWNRTD